MSEMKTVNLNGVTYEVHDPDALSGVDATLSKEGKPADAAAVGAAVSRLSADKAPSGYGLGIAEPTKITDCNTATKSGWYRFDYPTANAPTNAGGWLQVSTYSADYVEQTYYNISAVAAPDGVIACRFMNAGTWIPWEFLNPPMVEGVEYRTTERWNGKAVYTKLVDCGAFPSEGTKKDREIGSGVTKILRAEGTSANSGFTVPYTDNTACVHISATLYQGTALIILYVEKGDLTADSCIAQIWYTKD